MAPFERITAESDPVRWLNEMADSMRDTLGNAWHFLEEQLPTLDDAWPLAEPRLDALMEALCNLGVVTDESRSMVEEMRACVRRARPFDQTTAEDEDDMRYPQHIDEITKDSNPVRWLHQMRDSATKTLANSWSQLEAQLPALGTAWPPDDLRELLPVLQALHKVMEAEVETQLMVQDMREYVGKMLDGPADDA
jgi:hypothetical protein